MPTPRHDERSITRTYRTAIKIGEDFITLEETITLPLNASDEEVANAVELGWRIYAAQREAVERQIAAVREHQTPAASPIVVRDPDAPASDKQRNYIAALQDDLSWTSEQLASYATEQSVELVTLTKGQASTFIDGLKRLAEERAAYAEQPHSEPARRHANADAPNERYPASERQHQALAKLAQARGIDLDRESQDRFGVNAEALSADQASALIGEWQPRAQRASTR